VNLKVDLRMDEQYVPDMTQRLGVYRKIAAARSEDELDREVDEVRDRYGPLPVTVENLVTYARIRVLADRLRVESIDREGHAVVLKFRQDASVDPARLVNLLKKRPDVQMLPPAVLRLDLKHTGGASTAPVLAGGRRPGAAPAAAPGAGTGPRTGSGAGGGKFGRSTEKPAPSWWTKRATAEVAPGFTKENLTRQAADDPRAQGGLFDRVLGLLTELSDRP
jgi:transcription-repair coupling factor (superfamily II helicase)